MVWCGYLAFSLGGAYISVFVSICVCILPTANALSPSEDCTCTSLYDRGRGGGKGKRTALRSREKRGREEDAISNPFWHRSATCPYMRIPRLLFTRRMCEQYGSIHVVRNYNPVLPYTQSPHYTARHDKKDEVLF